MFRFINGEEVPPHFIKYYNIKGQEVKHDPVKYPYSFDPYCIFKDHEFQNYAELKEVHIAYSDRLSQQNCEKYEYACNKVFGSRIDIFPNNHKINENFLKVYFEKDIKLIGIEKGCNVGNGYPYWVFYYVEED